MILMSFFYVPDKAENVRKVLAESRTHRDGITKLVEQFPETCCLENFCDYEPWEVMRCHLSEVRYRVRGLIANSEEFYRIIDDYYSSNSLSIKISYKFSKHYDKMPSPDSPIIQRFKYLIDNK